MHEAVSTRALIGSPSDREIMSGHPAEQELCNRALLQYFGGVIEALLTSGTFRVASMPVAVTGARLRSRHGSSPSDLLALSEQVGRESAPPSELVLRTLDVLNSVTAPDNEAECLAGRAWAIPTMDLAGRFRSDRPQPDDFTFSFPVSPVDTTPPSFVDYASGLATIVVDSVDLLAGDVPVVPSTYVTADGVELPLVARRATVSSVLGDRLEVNGPFRRNPLHAIAATAPGIVALARHWGLLGRLLEVEGHDRVAGFSLLRNSDWIVESSGHPSEVYEQLARVCNVACTFCYLFGNPTDMAVARAKRLVSQDEIDTRLHYFSPETRRGLFTSQWEINEFLVDPKLPSVLRSLRTKTDQHFYFVTNGNPLTADVVDLLAEVGNIHLIVSTNTIDAPMRSHIMQERSGRTRTALSSLDQLREKGITFGASFVALPEFPFDKLAESMRRVIAAGAAFVRVNLPGFTANHPTQPTYDTDAFWYESVARLRSLRSSLDAPLFLIPSAYEMGNFEADPNSPLVFGAIPNSPAAVAGLRPGDVVRRIGSFSIRTRDQLHTVLALTTTTTEIEVERLGESVRLRLDVDAPVAYPYNGPIIAKYHFPHGVVSPPAINTRDLRSIRETLQTDDRHVGIFTSPVMQPMAAAALASSLGPDAGRVDLVVVQSEFLGGNIQILDMCTVNDIYRAWSRDGHGDLARVFLPLSGFNTYGRDLAGDHWGDLQQLIDVPVVPLEATGQFAY